MKHTVTLLILLSSSCLAAQTTIIPFTSVWKYLDDGSDPGTAWRAPSFSDAAWKSGPGELGYGDGDEATVVSYGPRKNRKYITTYFRKAVTVSDPSQYTTYSLRVKRDDGVVVYLNGSEIYRNNLPQGTLTYTTLAASDAADDGATPQSFTAPASAFVAGTNVIAVEIHQYHAASSDISFDLELAGSSTAPPPSSEGPTFIAFKSVWKYLDNGSDGGTAWRGTSFSDAGWKSGAGELGYGDGDETTIVSYGANANAKYITTYFRKTISITNPAQYASYTFSLIRDDGAVVYLNGVEVHRSNLPAGPVTYTTLASPAGAYNDGKPPQLFTLPASAFAAGTNVIAVEVHQNYANSPDLSFDMELVGSSSAPPPPVTTAILTRGPYLQVVSSSAATLRWRTDIATDSRIEAGTTLGSYTLSATNSTSTTEHEVRITGLTANTKYFYRFGSSSQVLQASSANYFSTAPPATTTQKIRIAAFGDCGLAGTVQQNVLNAYLSYVGSNPATLLLLLGDNAYVDGTDAEYQSQFFDRYSSTVLKNHALFPTPGNHDYHTTAQTARTAPYYRVFTLPTAGECGGRPSGTEAFYSWDWGPVHFLSLDSYGQEGDLTRLYDTLGPQVTWVKQDLAANTRKWTVVYFHHPPYTMGTHNSDTEGELIRIRQNFIRILERYGVDLVLCGHSHNYERSYLLRGYYGTEPTFNISTHAVTTSSGKYNGTANACPFTYLGGKYAHGTVYAVSGSAARSNATVQGSFPHSALPYATRAGGMFLLEVEDNRLDARLITETGSVFDQFTIMKDVNKTSHLSLSPGQPVTLTASWVGTYRWSSGATTRSITVSPASSTSYTVSDGQGCLTDVFNITIAATLAARDREATGEKIPGVYPTLVYRGQVVTAHTNEASEAVLVDNNGRQLRVLSFSGTTYIETRNLASGTYYLILRSAGKVNRHRLVVTD